MLAQVTGRFLFALGILILFSLFLFQSVQALAEDFHVVQVSKSLQMSEGETVYKDYYINAGSEQGIKKNMLVPVKRRLTVEDNFRKIIDDNVMIDVATIQIISVHSKVSIGRLVKVASEKKRGVLEFAAIMTGDKVDIRRAKMGKSGFWEGEQEKEQAIKEAKKQMTVKAAPVQAPSERVPAEVPAEVVPAKPVMAKKKSVAQPIANQESMLEVIPVITQ